MPEPRWARVVELGNEEALTRLISPRCQEKLKERCQVIEQMPGEGDGEVHPRALPV